MWLLWDWILINLFSTDYLTWMLFHTKYVELILGKQKFDENVIIVLDLFVSPSMFNIFHLIGFMVVS